jgi:hypothetical protein
VFFSRTPSSSLFFPKFPNSPRGGVFGSQGNLKREEKTPRLWLSESRDFSLHQAFMEGDRIDRHSNTFKIICSGYPMGAALP